MLFSATTSATALGRRFHSTTVSLILLLLATCIDFRFAVDATTHTHQSPQRAISTSARHHLRFSHFRHSTLRVVVTLCTHRDTLLSFGGFDANKQGLSYVECLATANASSWSPLPPMAQARGAFASCALGDTVHVAGGSVEDGGTDIGSHERFDIASQRWLSCAPLPDDAPWSGQGSAALANTFRVCSGWKGGPQATTLLYDARADRWQSCAAMSMPRSRFACCVLDDRLFALGGDIHCGSSSDSSSSESDGIDCTDTVEEYDATADRWRAAHFSLPQPLCSFSAAIIA